MAKNHNLLASRLPKYKSFLLVQSDGKWIPQHLSDKLMQLAFQIIEDREEEKKVYCGSLGNFFMETLV